MNYRVKICGMREAGNILEVAAGAPDWLGFIFYERSPRYATGHLDPEDLSMLPQGIRRAGVFVNAGIDQVIEMVRRYKLDAVQLHGDELPEYVSELRTALPDKSEVWKVFGVDAAFNPDTLKNYKNYCDAFLFDTKTSNYGGSGLRFDHALLQTFDPGLPYWISGGLGPDELKDFKPSDFPGLMGFDLNSRLEIRPGLKDATQVQEAIGIIRRFIK